MMCLSSSLRMDAIPDETQEGISDRGGSAALDAHPVAAEPAHAHGQDSLQQRET